MKFTPYYTVSYQGGFHPAGKPFDIDEKDAVEMQQHGLVEDTPPEEIPPEEIPHEDTPPEEIPPEDAPPRVRTAKK